MQCGPLCNRLLFFVSLQEVYATNIESKLNSRMSPMRARERERESDENNASKKDKGCAKTDVAEAPFQFNVV